MIRPKFSTFNVAVAKRWILAIVPLGILHALSWVARSRVIDGESIVKILAAITILNLILFGLLFSRFPRYALITIASTYFFHFLFLLLLFVEQRRI